MEQAAWLHLFHPQSASEWVGRRLALRLRWVWLPASMAQALRPSWRWIYGHYLEQRGGLWTQSSCLHWWYPSECGLPVNVHRGWWFNCGLGRDWGRRRGLGDRRRRECGDIRVGFGCCRWRFWRFFLGEWLWGADVEWRGDSGWICGMYKALIIREAKYKQVNIMGCS